MAQPHCAARPRSPRHVHDVGSRMRANSERRTETSSRKGRSRARNGRTRQRTRQTERTPRFATSRRPGNGYSKRLRAHSSAGERSLHTREVPGSIPGAPIRKGAQIGAFLRSRICNSPPTLRRARFMRDSAPVRQIARAVFDAESAARSGGFGCNGQEPPDEGLPDSSPRPTDYEF